MPKCSKLKKILEFIVTRCKEKHACENEKSGYDNVNVKFYLTKRLETTYK